MGRHLLNAFAAAEPDRFARQLADAENLDDAVAVLSEIDNGLDGDIVARLSPELANRILAIIPDPVLTEWLDAGPTDAGRRMLSKMDPARAAGLIERISDRAKRRALRRLSVYAADSIGQLTQVRAVSIKEDTTAAKIRAQLQRLAGSLEGPVVIERKDGTVMGLLDFQHLAQNADDSALAADFCIPVKPVFADAPMSSMAQLKKSGAWTQLGVLPVVDHDEKLVGYVSRADLENAGGSKLQSSLFLESVIELVKRYWEFMMYTTMVVFDRRNTR